jgi:2-keto-3-deoxy-L-rhamnonate aldolase RhmA
MSTVRDRAGWVGLREKLRSSTECVLGTWVKIPALETVEMLAAVRFDFVVLDEEHSPLTLESGYRATALSQALGMHVLVWTPDRSGDHVPRLLDSGVDGLLVPQVSSVEEARRVVGDMVFAPEGRRGLGSTSRAGLWGTIANEEYVRPAAGRPGLPGAHRPVPGRGEGTRSALRHRGRLRAGRAGGGRARVHLRHDQQ